MDSKDRRAKARTYRRKTFLRLHAIEGQIAKVYPLDDKRLETSWLGRAVNLRGVKNIYIEDSSLSYRLRGDERTIWHAIVLPESPLPASSMT